MMKTLILSVKERLQLIQHLPANGGRIEMIVVANLGKHVEFTPEEISEYELKDAPGGGVRGNVLKFQDKSFSLTPDQVNILKSIPAKLDEAKQITIDLLPLLDKIDYL
jgi:hypothetical protein